jgi:hypothetical protein
MNTITNLTVIGSLVLGLWTAGDLSGAKRAKNPQATPATAQKLGANHNEILVKDTGPDITKVLPVQLQESILNNPQPVSEPDCLWLECGPEIAGSLRIDTQKVRETKSQDSWLTSVWEFFFRGTNTPRPCDDWGCGMNHSEVLARKDQ